MIAFYKWLFPVGFALALMGCVGSKPALKPLILDGKLPVLEQAPALPELSDGVTIRMGRVNNEVQGRIILNRKQTTGFSMESLPTPQAFRGEKRAVIFAEAGLTMGIVRQLMDTLQKAEVLDLTLAGRSGDSVTLPTVGYRRVLPRWEADYTDVKAQKLFVLVDSTGQVVVENTYDPREELDPAYLINDHINKAIYNDWGHAVFLTVDDRATYGDYLKVFDVSVGAYNQWLGDYGKKYGIRWIGAEEVPGFEGLSKTVWWEELIYSEADFEIED